MSRLVSDVIRRVSRSFGDTDKIFILDADYYDWVTAGQLSIVRETDCTTTVVPSTGGAFNTGLTLPVDFIRMQRILYNGDAIEFVAIQDLDQKDINPASAQTAQAVGLWYIDNNKIYLYPTPAASDTTVVSYEYTPVPAIIASGATTLIIPDQYFEGLCDFVLAKAHERNQDAQKYTLAMTRHQEEMAKDIEDEARQLQTYPVIRDDPWENW